jgi:streptogramin lyase
LLFCSLLSAAEITTITEAKNPYGLTIGPDGALYICEIDAHKVTRLDLKTKEHSDFAPFKQPYEVRFDRKGIMYVDDMPGQVVQRVDPKTKTITTIAGTGSPGFAGDGGPAAQAQFNQPHSIAFDRDGALLICDIANHRIRRLDMKTMTISTYSGTGEKKLPTEGAKLQGTPLFGPRAIAFDRTGNMFIVLREGNAVYKVDRKSGEIHRFAGTGEKGYTGDGASALEAKLNGPKGISCAPDGSVYIADTENHAIRRIDTKGMITTIAGTGKRGDGPDGDPLKCQLSRPHGIFVGKDGTVYIGDSESNKVRIVR